MQINIFVKTSLVSKPIKIKKKKPVQVGFVNITLCLNRSSVSVLVSRMWSSLRVEGSSTSALFIHLLLRCPPFYCLTAFCCCSLRFYFHFWIHRDLIVVRSNVVILSRLWQWRGNITSPQGTVETLDVLVISLVYLVWRSKEHIRNKEMTRVRLCWNNLPRNYSRWWRTLRWWLESTDSRKEQPTSWQS